ncbi:MAG: hypothetical protein ABI438_08625 [Dermatophilaceae bacterium]
MRRPQWITGGLVALLAMGAAALAPPVARAAGPASAASATHATAAVRGVTLVTGDSVRVTKDVTGRTIVQGLPATRAGAGAAFQTVTSPKHTYVVPASARPYLGRFLDPALFDVTTLSGAGARIPVRLTFTGAAVPTVPGVTVTSSTAGAASGYLTASSARRFGSALADQYRVDAKAQFPKRATLFGATKVFADVSIPPVVTPLYPMRTLIIKLLGSDGAPAPFGFMTISNTDSFAKFFGFAIVVDGEARVSVPIGTYAFDTAVDELDAAGNFFGFGVVTKSDYVVSAQNQVVTLDGRTATSRLSVSTPRSADLQTEEFDIVRTDTAGTGGSWGGFALLGPGVIYVAPAKAPISGTLTSAAAWTLTGEPLSGAPYAYSLHFEGAAGIPASQAYTVKAAQLAMFRSRFYVDVVPRAGGVLTYPVFPASGFGGGWSFPVQLPSNLLTYVNASPGAVWFTTVFGSPDPFTNPFAGVIDDGPRLATAGTTYSADWGRGPDLPNVPVETSGSSALFPVDCLSCRTAGQLQVALNFATDSTPGHAYETFGNLDGTPVARLRIYRNGALLSDNSDTGFAQVAVPAASATYRILDEVNRVPSLALQSLTTRTEITFVSAAGKGGSLPPAWTCYLGTGCTVLPLLQTAVDLPTNLVGSVPLGTSTIDLTLAHIQGAPATGIASGLVEIRRPGGAWTKLPIAALGAGAYRATLKTVAADAGTELDLRVTGTDTAGGKIVQTATSAFAVAIS